MCYRKPGPRCSSHAAVALAKAKHGLAVSAHTPEDYFAAKDKENEAQKVFDSTPSGLRILKDELLNPLAEAGISERYTAAKLLREEQLAAVKKLGLVQEKHANRPVTSAAFTAKFSAADVVREYADVNMLNSSVDAASEEYFSRLSDEELSQLRWMTDYGAMEANKHIAGVNSYTLFQGAFQAEDIEKRMKIVDEALAKYQPSQPVVTYRGVRNASLPVPMQENYRVTPEEKQQVFLDALPVGSVMSSDFYMPSSFQPNSSVKFADFGVVMEIKSSSAAPVSAISVSSREHEGLLPRGISLKVVDVQKNVKYSDGTVNRRTGEPSYRTVTVVQLEEIE